MLFSGSIRKQLALLELQRQPGDGGGQRNENADENKNIALIVDKLAEKRYIKRYKKGMIW